MGGGCSGGEGQKQYRDPHGWLRIPTCFRLCVRCGAGRNNNYGGRVWCRFYVTVATKRSGGLGILSARLCPSLC